MKLLELNPRWFNLEDGGQRVGLTFDCPHCRHVRLGVIFHHAGREAMEDAYIHAHDDAKFIWTESGDDFGSVTITPSIDASHAGHWHGFIMNGEIK